VARGTQHRKRRPQANARVAQPAPKSKRPQHQSWEDQLFFSRLRVHAKWVFFLLALVFAFSFVLFGVGSGSTGINDVLQNFFSGGGGGSSGKSASSLEKATRAHPNDPTTWRALASKLEQEQKVDGAIAALERYTTLKPKDQNGLEELANLYVRRVRDYGSQYVNAQTRAQFLAPSSMFQPPASSRFGRAFQDPAGLQDPIANAVSKSTNNQLTIVLAKLRGIEGRAVDVYKQLVVLQPGNATNQYQLGQVAQDAGNTPTAIKAYRKFLALAPNDSLAPSAKQALQQLTGTGPKRGSGG
jgi:tetratricopeptide (TPR) repeat protein